MSEQELNNINIVVDSTPTLDETISSVSDNKKAAIVWNISEGKLEYMPKGHSYFSFEIEWQTDVNLKWPSNKAVWKEKQPPDSSFTQDSFVQFLIVKRNNMPAIQVSHLLPQNNNQLDFRSLQWVRGRYQILKSASQKYTRLSQVDRALRVTWLILCTQDSDMIEKLLRRWCIILAEDAMLHPIFSYFFFFQVAITRGWVLNDYAKFVLLRGIEAATQPHIPADWRCDYIVKEVLSENQTQTMQQVAVDVQNLMLLSILGRASYGGMKGDMGLLHSLWETWRKRFHGDLPLPPQWNDFISNEWLHKDSDSRLLLLCDDKKFRWQFTPEDFISTAIDMHCSSILVLLMDKCNIPGDALVQLSSLIWDRRSSLRIRPCTCGQHADDETIASSKQLVQPQDPEWWSAKVVPVLHSFCVNEWYQPTYFPIASSFSNNENKTSITSRSDILQSQMKDLLQKRRRNSNNSTNENDDVEHETTDTMSITKLDLKKLKRMQEKKENAVLKSYSALVGLPAPKNNKSLMQFFKSSSNNEGQATTVVKLEKIKGELVHPYDVYAGREMHSHDWVLEGSAMANFFTVSEFFDVKLAVEAYYCWLFELPFDFKHLGFESTEQIQRIVDVRPSYIPSAAEVRMFASQQRGKRIACWCKNAGEHLTLCHVDVLIYWIEKGRFCSLALKKLIQQRNLIVDFVHFSKSQNEKTDV
jgi:hypothetical protein